MGNDIYNIIRICEKYNITDYTINDDLSIDVDGDVDLSSYYLCNLPLTFNIVSGDFSCWNSNLTTLSGAPREVSGDFLCYNNRLEVFEHFPTKVSGYIYCDSNQIEPIEYNHLFEMGYALDQIKTDISDSALAVLYRKFVIANIIKE